MPQVTLTHCPDCGYSFHNLPARHRCSECGFAYDERTRVWRPSNAVTLFLLAFLLQGFGILVLDLAQYGLAIPRHGFFGNFGLVVDLLTVGFIILIVYAIRARKHWFVAITPRGIEARTLRGRTCITWQQVRESAGNGASPVEFVRGKIMRLGVPSRRKPISFFSVDVDTLVDYAQQAYAVYVRAGRAAMPDVAPQRPSV